MSRLEKRIVNSRLQLRFYRRAGMHEMFRRKELGRPGRILEMGCGVGHSTRELAKRYPESHITAIDSDAEQLKHTPQIKNVAYRLADATKTGFDSASFDAVFEFFTLHHISQYKRMIKEAHRALKPGGVFVIMDTALKWLDPLHFLFFRKLSYFRRSEVIKTLQKTGFCVEHASRHVHFTIIARKKG